MESSSGNGVEEASGATGECQNAVEVSKTDDPVPCAEGTLPQATTPSSIGSDDNLVASSYIPPKRRKGWFNRRGDQLWTNDGRYRPPQKSEEYPEDLAEYPGLCSHLSGQSLCADDRPRFWRGLDE
jgi:hypothetical protein